MAREAICRQKTSQIKQGTLNYVIESGEHGTTAVTLTGKDGGVCIEFEPHEIGEFIRHLELGKTYSLDQQEYSILGICFDPA